MHKLMAEMTTATSTMSDRGENEHENALLYRLLNEEDVAVGSS